MVKFYYLDGKLWGLDSTDKKSHIPCKECKLKKLMPDIKAKDINSKFIHLKNLHK